MKANAMLIRVFTTDDQSDPILAVETQVDAAALMAMAQPREAEARQRGAEWTAGAIPFFVQELADALAAGKPAQEIDMHATNAAMAAWLYDSVHDGVSADIFAECDLVFTLSPGGVVQYDRTPATAG